MLSESTQAAVTTYQTGRLNDRIDFLTVLGFSGRPLRCLPHLHTKQSNKTPGHDGFTGEFQNSQGKPKAYTLGENIKERSRSHLHL